MNTTPLSPDQPARYRVCLQGRITADWTDWLLQSCAAFEEDQTHITGLVRDQAALFGLLSFVRDLGVSLLLVEYLAGSLKQEGESNEAQSIEDRS
jgi:hypothetical protein